MAARVILSLLFLPVALAEKWAVIAAGSQGFMNYRHQADACHAYQIMLKSGVPAANIILMMQDDVAKSSENPFPGQLFNKPGNASLDVYKGCKVDYSGDIVTAQLFLDVLTGKGKGKEACESGSMLPDLKDDGKILAVTASNGKESSWGTYCGDEAVVKGKNIGSCLGDLFSVNWMEDDDLGKLASETFRSQISKVTKLTNKSHVCSFGDKSFEDEAIGRVEGALISDVFSDSSKGAVDARDIYVTQAYWAWQNAAVDQKEKAWARFVGIVNDRERDDQLFATMGRQACGSTKVQLDECQQSILGDRAEMKDMDCHKKLATLVHEHCPVSSSHHATGGWNGYNMKFSQVLLNLCEHQEELGQSVDQLAQIVEEECSKAICSK
ncbi:unnamed protein product [Durusdinium trenchii]|uniref:Uncharacterized protein n=1 Tax=Durusdinium trenchii TaxID=1381693 RepID=A0ABP0HED3_9DINO